MTSSKIAYPLVSASFTLSPQVIRRKLQNHRSEQVNRRKGQQICCSAMVHRYRSPNLCRSTAMVHLRSLWFTGSASNGSLLRIEAKPIRTVTLRAARRQGCPKQFWKMAKSIREGIRHEND